MLQNSIRLPTSNDIWKLAEAEADSYFSTHSQRPISKQSQLYQKKVAFFYNLLEECLPGLVQANQEYAI